MAKTKELLAAARAMDWPALKVLLVQLPNPERIERTEWLVAEIRQQGYMVCRRDVPGEILRRDGFRSGFRQYLEEEGFQPFSDAWREDDVVVSSIEWGYHRILQSVEAQKLDDDRLVWGMLRRLGQQGSVLRDAVANWKPHDGQRMDVVNLRVPLPDGSSVQPDNYLTTVVDAATATLKMLGIKNRWFGNDGVLHLPNPQPLPVLDVPLVENVQSLGIIWAALERTDEHLRFFGGDAKVQQREVDANGKRVQVSVLEAEIDGEQVIFDRIAHDRRAQMLQGFWNQLHWETLVEGKVSNVIPCPLPPAAFISTREAHSGISVSQILCTPVVEHLTEYSGLQIVEWIRCYAALALFAEAKLAAFPDEDPYQLDLGELLKYLTDRGITDAKAAAFLHLATFARKDADLFDAPIVQTSDGRMFLATGIARYINPVEVVLSKLATLQAKLSWRGPAFEKTVRKVFTDQGVAVRHIDRTVNGQPLEVDCVAFWDGILFVFECKNFSLSGKTNEGTYRFFQEQAHAVEQVTRKRDTLLANQSILNKEFGQDLKINRTVSVVLNAMPFSLGAIDTDLFVYDFSAMGKFFKDSHYRIIMPAKVAHGTVLRRHGVKAMWSGEKPSALDLISEMEDPTQIRLAMAEYEWGRIRVPLGRLVALSTFRNYLKTPAGVDGGTTAARRPVG